MNDSTEQQAVTVALWCCDCARADEVAETLGHVYPGGRVYFGAIPGEGEAGYADETIALAVWPRGAVSRRSVLRTMAPLARAVDLSALPCVEWVAECYEMPAAPLWREIDPKEVAQYVR